MQNLCPDCGKEMAQTETSFVCSCGRRVGRLAMPFVESYEPTYKEYVEIQWMRLAPKLRELAEFAEVAADYVDHLRNE